MAVQIEFQFFHLTFFTPLMILLFSSALGIMLNSSPSHLRQWPAGGVSRRARPRRPMHSRPRAHPSSAAAWCASRHTPGLHGHTTIIAGASAGAFIRGADVQVYPLRPRRRWPCRELKPLVLLCCCCRRQWYGCNHPGLLFDKMPTT
jgi:hypothetical protein